MPDPTPTSFSSAATVGEFKAAIMALATLFESEGDVCVDFGQTWWFDQVKASPDGRVLICLTDVSRQIGDDSSIGEAHQESICPAEMILGELQSFLGSSPLRFARHWPDETEDLLVHFKSASRCDEESEIEIEFYLDEQH